MEQVVVRWRHLVASSITLDMLHLATCFVMHRRTAMAIEMAGRQGTFDHHQQFCHCHNGLLRKVGPLVRVGDA
jgi:hypothetical protein